MPANAEWEDYFGVDKVGEFQLDNSPRYERRILEENDRWYIETSEWGVTRKCFKQEDSTPEYLDYKVIDEETWAHNHGIVSQLHSCGDVRTLVPDILETGVDALNPLEVKAGMDPVAIKKQYGDRLLLRGGINAVNWSNKDAIMDEIHHKIPILKENGGFIFSSDHSIPNSVSLENMSAIIEEVKRIGKY